MTSTMLPSITFKLDYGGDLRRWTTLRSPLALDTIASKVRSLYGLSECPHPLRYTDIDSDSVTLSSQQDVQELLIQRLQVVRVTVPKPQSTETHLSEAEDVGSNLPLWSIWRTEKYLKRLAYNTSILTCDPEARQMVLKLLEKSQGRLSLSDTEKVLIVLQATTEGRPLIRNVLSSMAADDDTPLYSRAILRRAVNDDPLPDLIHHGHTCCGCGMVPIVGLRYANPVGACSTSLCGSCYRSKLNEEGTTPKLSSKETTIGAIPFWSSVSAPAPSHGCLIFGGGPTRGYNAGPYRRRGW